MVKLKSNTTLYLLFYFIIGFFPFFLTNNIALSYSKYNYAIAQFLVFKVLFSLVDDDRNSFLLSPSFLAVSYINLNFFIGSIVFNEGLVFDFLLKSYSKWENYSIVMGYFNLINFTIVVSFFFARKIKMPFNIKLLSNFKNYSRGLLIFVGILVIGFFSFYELKIPFLGGQGAFSIIPKTIGAIILLVCFSRTNGLFKRLFYYAVIVGLFSAFSSESKRDAIFLLLPIIFLESKSFKVKLNFKKFVLIVCSVGLILQLILAMSIYRGYGGFQPKNFWEANTYVIDYVKSNSFIPAFMNNLEISYTYFHSNNAIETILNKPENLTYGETLIKPFFIFFPRKIVPFKPQSIIHHYTVSVSKSYRKRGGSWPVSIQSEMFWNFHFFGVLVGGLIFLLFNSIYLRIRELILSNEIINFIPLLYFYQTTLVLFRGSGLDMFVVFIIMATIFFLFLKLILRVLLSK